MNIPRYDMPASMAGSSTPGSVRQFLPSGQQLGTMPINLSRQPSEVNQTQRSDASWQRPPFMSTPSTSASASMQPSASTPQFPRPGDSTEGGSAYSQPIEPFWAQEKGWKPDGRPMSMARGIPMDDEVIRNRFYNTNIPLSAEGSMRPMEKTQGPAPTSQTSQAKQETQLPPGSLFPSAQRFQPQASTFESRLVDIWKRQQEQQQLQRSMYDTSFGAMYGQQSQPSFGDYGDLTGIPVHIARSAGLRGIAKRVHVPIRTTMAGSETSPTAPTDYTSQSAPTAPACASVWDKPPPEFSPPSRLWEVPETTRDMFSQWLKTQLSVADRQRDTASENADHKTQAWKRAMEKKTDAWKDLTGTFNDISTAAKPLKNPAVDRMINELRQSLSVMARSINEETRAAVEMGRSREVTFESTMRGRSFSDYLTEMCDQNFTMERAREIWDSEAPLTKQGAAGYKEVSPWDRFMRSSTGENEREDQSTPQTSYATFSPATFENDTSAFPRQQSAQFRPGVSFIPQATTRLPPEPPHGQHHLYSPQKFSRWSHLFPRLQGASQSTSISNQSTESHRQQASAAQAADMLRGRHQEENSHSDQEFERQRQQRARALQMAEDLLRKRQGHHTSAPYSQHSTQQQHPAWSSQSSQIPSSAPCSRSFQSHQAPSQYEYTRVSQEQQQQQSRVAAALAELMRRRQQ